MHPYKIDAKFLEIIINLIREQNEQLLSIIAEEEEVSKRVLVPFLPLRHELMHQLNVFVASSQTRQYQSH